MKKILLFTVAILFVTVGSAQNKAQKEPVKVGFYGVDFSAVNVVGASETEEKFIAAFENINNLLILEPQKYDAGKFLRFDIQSMSVDHAISQVGKLQNVKFKDNKDSKITLKEIVDSYPTIKGNALIIVAKKLNKSTNVGTFVAVVFDGDTKQIISEQEFSGKAKGFGLRNFWAGALYDGLKSVRFNRTSEI